MENKLCKNCKHDKRDHILTIPAGYSGCNHKNCDCKEFKEVLKNDDR